ncbi:hypothetical protein [Halomonas llamarensis]|uniref:DUF3311 domain-containing protein n=1 Tax=Halomonas llamarensis TaxID=2945104 RepID=A0ABT0SMK0_9GAMM|nr:hypothetical protein [Halomonas llamarensis]MCL7929025.1 hypothetical protein [Halomonas llamarensis]
MSPNHDVPHDSHQAPHRDSRHHARLIALILLAVLLFCPPVLVVIDRLPGVASLALYLFGAWALVIALGAWLMEHSAKH